jgi:hypothetical protein
MTKKMTELPIDKSGKPVQMPIIRKAAAERQPLCSQDVSATRLDGGLDTTSQVTSKCSSCQVIDWPDNSPNLNFVESCWNHMENLTAVIKDLWSQELTINYLQELSDSMPKWLQMATEAKGKRSSIRYDRPSTFHGVMNHPFQSKLSQNFGDFYIAIIIPEYFFITLMCS